MDRLEAAPLALAQATLRLAQPHISALSHVVFLVSQWLDTSLRLPLANAASSGSIGLLNRVASHLFNDQQLHPAVRDHAFARAMEAAIKKDDLMMVKQIHELHPEPLVFKTLRAAIKYGSLEMVEWIVEHRHDRLCCPPGLGNLCKECLRSFIEEVGKHDAYRVVQWLCSRGYSSINRSGFVSHEIRLPVASNVELVKWLRDTGRLTRRVATAILEDAVAGATAQHLEVINCLAEVGFTIDESAVKKFLIQASLKDNTEATVEYVINSSLCDAFRHEFLYAPHRPGGKKVIQWNPDRLDPSLQRCYASTVEGLRWLYDHFPDTEAGVWTLANAQERQVLELYKWLHANSLGSWSTDDMDNAARRGFLEVVQWLHLNRGEGCTTYAMDQAAVNGHLVVVQWLHANRAEGCTEGGANGAAANGHTDVVAWLFTHRNEVHTTTAMTAAATSGQVEMMAWLHENRPDDCTSCVLRVLLRSPFHLKTAHSERVGVLYSLRWLRDHQPETECGEACMEHPPASSLSLLAQGFSSSDLQLLAFLHSYYRDFGVQDEVMYALLGRRVHLPAMKWIHEHYRNDFDWHRVRDIAVQRRDIRRVSWLDRIIPGSELA